MKQESSSFGTLAIFSRIQGKQDGNTVTSIKNLFSYLKHRYANGASTNPDAHVVAYAAAQVKKGLDVAKKLNAENFVFWGGREGYQSLLNTDLNRELSNMARFYKMVVGEKDKFIHLCKPGH